MKMSAPKTKREWDLESGNIMHHLLPHVVAIGWIHALKEPRSNTGDRQVDYDSQYSICSAFLYEAQGLCMMMTAGHVISAMNTSIGPDRRLVKARIFDGMGEQPTPEAVPFPLDVTPRYHIDREDLGWDLGAIPIGTHWLRLLAASGKRPFSESTISGIDRKFDAHVLLGFPTEHRKTPKSRRGTVVTYHTTLGTPLLPLRRIIRPPAVLKKSIPRFYGKITRDEFSWNGEKILLSDIDGMSGGPIIGLKFKRSSIEYRLVAVQSGWSKKRRIVAGCPLADIGSAVVQRMRKEGILQH